MNKIIVYLTNLDLKTFTEQDALDYCLLNNINPDSITDLYLDDNLLENISEIKLFKNLEYLNISFNKITDISVLKNLTELEHLSIGNNQITDISFLQNLNNLKSLNIRGLELKSDQIQYINSLNNLKELIYYKGFKDISVLNKLNKNIRIIK